jgi:hypothetical protein
MFNVYRHVRYVRHLGPIIQKIYPLDKSYPLNKSSSIYTSYPVDKYLSSGYSFEQHQVRDFIYREKVLCNSLFGMEMPH